MLNDTVRVYLTMIKRLMNYKESKTPDGISSGCVVMKKCVCLLHLHAFHHQPFTLFQQLLSHPAGLARYKNGEQYACANSVLFKRRAGSRYLIAIFERYVLVKGVKPADKRGKTLLSVPPFSPFLSVELTVVVDSRIDGPEEL